MKILLTGGGSGGHFYPIIAVAQALNKITKTDQLTEVQLYYMAPQPYDAKALADNNLKFVRVSAGKMRRYFSILNFFDYFKTGFGVLKAIWSVFMIYPDVVFGKGGYVSFPAVLAARLLRIPVVIHESDSHPGRVNMWAGRFAKRIAVSYPEASEFFVKDKVAFTGNPIRGEIMIADHAGGHEFLKLDKSIPVIFVLGGSQGSETVNDAVVDTLLKLLEKYQIVHMVGKNNLTLVTQLTDAVLMNSELKNRYKIYDRLDSLTMRMAAGAASLIISRAGSTIFEIAHWEIPAILIPITASNGNHQRKNAYSYARTGAAEVIEENNLTGHILYSEIERIMNNPELQQKMKAAAKTFSKIDAADRIAKEIISIALEHEK